MNNTIYPLAVIGVIAVVTWALRAFPFLLFGNRPLPKVIRYLGKALPPAIMTVLVIYCLRDISFSQSPFGIPELAACALVVILQAVRKNMYLSIIAGTVCYMVLIRVKRICSGLQMKRKLGKYILILFSMKENNTGYV